MTNRIGDRPRFPLPNQRFDKGDADNIAQYYEEIISRFTGSIYGQAWGCVSNPGFSVVPVVISGALTQYHMRFERCVLLYSVPEQGSVQAPGIDRGPWQATLVAYDPDEESQPVQSLSVNVFATAQSRPWILFRRRETSSSVGNKAYWDTALNTERIGTANLKQAEYVEFRLSLSYTTSDTTDGWYRMAYIDSWAGIGASATPTIIPIHWMDSQYYADNTPPTRSVAVGSALASPSFGAAFGEKGFNPYNEMPNLAKLMHWIAGKLGQHYSTTSTLQVSAADQALYNVKPGAFVLNYGDVGGGWLSTPPRGLLELHNGLEELEASILPLITEQITEVLTAINEFSVKYTRTPRLLHSLYIRPVVAVWPLVSYQTIYDETTTPANSFSPTLLWLGAGVSINPVRPNTIVYRIVTQGVLETSEDERKFTLELYSSSYVLTAVQIVPHIDSAESLTNEPGISINQRYVTVVPPASNLTVNFVIERTEGTAEDVVRPFTIYIYGRNV